MACEFDEPFILDTGKYEPAFWAASACAAAWPLAAGRWPLAAGQ